MTTISGYPENGQQPKLSLAGDTSDESPALTQADLPELLSILQHKQEQMLAEVITKSDLVDNLLNKLSLDANMYIDGQIDNKLDAVRIDSIHAVAKAVGSESFALIQGLASDFLKQKAEIKELRAKCARLTLAAKVAKIQRERSLLEQKTYRTRLNSLTKKQAILDLGMEFVTYNLKGMAKKIKTTK